MAHRETEFDEPLAQCPFCGSRRLAPHDRTAGGVTIDRCRDCDLLFMNPQYSDARLARYYASYITADQRTGDEPGPKRRQKRAALSRVIPFKQGGRFLAVGCGSGLELEVARELGFAVEGCDVDPATVRAVAARTGVPIHCGDFATMDLPAGAYDCVFLDHVLEHTKEPAAFLRRIRRLLKPDGILYLGVPNVGTVFARLKTAAGRLGLRPGRRGSHYDADHHLFYYRPGPLGRSLETEFGFVVLGQGSDPRVDMHPVRASLYRRFPWLCTRMAFVARPRRDGA